MDKKKKRGRPDVSFMEKREIYMTTRMNIRDIQVLNEIRHLTGMKKADIVRNALREYLYFVKQDQSGRDISDEIDDLM